MRAVACPTRRIYVPSWKFDGGRLVPRRSVSGAIAPVVYSARLAAYKGQNGIFASPAREPF